MIYIVTLQESSSRQNHGLLAYALAIPWAIHSTGTLSAEPQEGSLVSLLPAPCLSVYPKSNKWSILMLHGTWT